MDVGEGRKAGTNGLHEGRKESGSEGDGFGVGRDEADNQGVGLGGQDEGGGVEEGGRKRDGDFVVFEGARRKGSEAGEEDVGQ